MNFDYFIRGLLIGLSIAAPIGPMGVLVIRRTLAEGRLAGLITGLGIAAGDTIYGALGGFGLTLITGFLINEQFWLRLAGGFFLIYLGIKTLVSRPAEKAAESRDKGRGLAGYFITSLLLTLTNPLTIISFAAIMAGLGIGSASGNYLSATILVLGVAAGSTGWWLILTTGVSLLKNKFTPGGMVWVNRLSGLVITLFGLLALWSLVRL
ncbi:MAG: putative threonine efflux protein [Chloroflexi bacterium]|jgi:threonine/homoserine/homoserine lactone efflux protein|nr:putative threonine efflux protein [Chloroflexota bacterium]